MFNSICIYLGWVALTAATPLSTPLEIEDSEVNPFIVGGTDAPKNFAPHMVAIVVGDELKILVCGGSLISPIHVLTAAHCIDPYILWGQLLESYRTIVGTNDWFRDGITTHVKNYHIHPKYSSIDIKYDVAVLDLKLALRLSDSIGFISLGNGWVGAGERCYVTGWRRLQAWGVVPYRLQLLYVETISPHQCIEGVRNASIVHGQAPQVSPSIELCTFHSVNHGMCNGDSGSALVSINKRQQVGIVSWGFPCARGAPDVYVRISGVLDFITHIMRK